MAHFLCFEQIRDISVMSAFECFMTIPNLFALVSLSQFLRGVVYCIQGRDLQEKETADFVVLQKTSAFCNERNILLYISTSRYYIGHITDYFELVVACHSQ